jgi:hypothetical protein
MRIVPRSGDGTLPSSTHLVNKNSPKTSEPKNQPATCASLDLRLKALRASRLDLRGQLREMTARQRGSPLWRATRQEIEVVTDEIVYIEQVLDPDSPLNFKVDPSTRFMLEVTRPQRPDGSAAVSWQRDVSGDPDGGSLDFIIFKLEPGAPYRAVLNGVQLFGGNPIRRQKVPNCTLRMYGTASKEMLDGLGLHSRIEKGEPVADLITVPIITRQPVAVWLGRRVVIAEPGE